MALYEITGNIRQIQDIMDQADMSDPEQAQALKDTLDAETEEFAAKAESIIKLVKDYQAEADALEQEADRLAKRSREEANKAKWLKSYLQDQMVISGQTKIKAGLFRVTVAKNGGKAPMVIDADLDMIPYKYKTMQWKIDMDGLRQAVEAGDEEVKGMAHLEERGQHLVIR